MNKCFKTSCAVGLFAVLVIALLMCGADTSLAQRQNETAPHVLATEDLLERAQRERDPADNRRLVCGLESSSTLPAAKARSAFHTTSNPTPPPPSITPVLGPQNTLFILLNFLDNQITPITREDMYAAAFTYPRGIANFYDVTSYGKISIVGDVAGWFTIPYNENGTCNVGTWRIAARDAATAAGFDLTSYTHFVYVWPRNNPSTGVSSYGCGWDGMSSIGGPDAYINGWVNPNGFFYDGYQGHLPDQLISTICHEFGHGLRLQHAGTLRCDDGKKTIDDYSSCTRSYTADFDDVMGYENPARELNASHRAALGWVDSGQVQDVTTDGTYVISPLEYRDSNVKALRIRKADTSECYYLSYRLPVGPFDFYLSSANGTSIHTWDGYQDSFTWALYALPWTAASTYSMSPSALIDGMRFEDSVNGIQVTQVSHDANGVAVSIKFGRIPCQNYEPLVSVFTGWGIKANAGYSSQPFTLLVFNRNCATCPASNFTLGSAGPFGWSTLYSGSVHTIQAQSYVMLNDQVQTSAGSAVGDYSFTVAATRTDAPAYTASASGTVRITTSDVSPPTAPTNLIAWADNTTVLLSWSASTDNVGVTSYTIMRNDITAGGSVFSNTTSTSYADTGTDPNHLYSYTVYARDAGLQSRTAVVKGSVNLPLIDIIAPVDGTAVSGTVSVTVSAASGRGVSKVDLYVDNKLTNTSTVAPFTTSWNTRRVASGRHTLQCKAYDTVANVGVSGAVAVNK
jgi:M6 family metalloprotease-like protein